MRRKNDDTIDNKDAKNQEDNTWEDVNTEDDPLKRKKDDDARTTTAAAKDGQQQRRGGKPPQQKEFSIAYPHLAKSNRRKLLDNIYMGVVICMCVCICGMTIGFQSILSSINKKTSTIIQLPPNDKIPTVLLESIVRRRRQLSLPLLLENLPLPTRDDDDDGFEYPTDAIENSTFTTTTINRHYSRMQYPMEMDDEVGTDNQYADFGPVDIRFLTQEDQKREIFREIWEGDGHARSLGAERDDDVEEFWAFDWLRNPYVAYDDVTIQDEKRCRRTNWHRLRFPTGNIIHEIDPVTNTPELVGVGAYREVFFFENNFKGKEEDFVLKEILYSRDMDYDCHEYVRVDALITERMTSNNLIVNIYAFTGFSMITEAFSYGDVEDDLAAFEGRSKSFRPLTEPELVNYNNYTGTEKLKLALGMVEPVAALHNYEGGVIIHDDIQLSQYLWTDETKTSVKLNDFNRAEVMFWDEDNEEYCRYKNGKGAGDWRAPEEYLDKPLNEKIDIWSLGNNFFTILTGYYPFPHIPETSLIKKYVSKGFTGKIDPRFRTRSFAEHELADIIERCWIYDPDKRPSINELQEMLEGVIAEDERLAASNYTKWYEYRDSLLEEIAEDDSDSDSSSSYEDSESFSDYEEESHGDHEDESEHEDENEYESEDRPESDHDAAEEKDVQNAEEEGNDAVEEEGAQKAEEEGKGEG